MQKAWALELRPITYQPCDPKQVSDPQFIFSPVKCEEYQLGKVTREK